MPAIVSAWAPAALRPYLTRPALAAFLFGISSGFPYALLAATLTQWLSEAGVERKTVAIFSWVLFTYNLKVLWAPLIDRVPIPWLTARLGQRRSWLLVISILLTAAIWNLALQDPNADLSAFAWSAILVGICGASLDIVIDAYRIELLKANEQGVGAAVSQYGWRMGTLIAANIVLGVAAVYGWSAGYIATSSVVLFGLVAGFWIGEPSRPPASDPGAQDQTREQAPLARLWGSLQLTMVAPFADFFLRVGAWAVLLFILLHKIGDTLANLMLRNMLVALEFTKDEIRWADVNFGMACLFLGIFVGGVIYARWGVKRAVMLGLILMMVSNLSFAALAQAGHSVLGLAATMGFENFASGMGGVAVVGYLSLLCNQKFTATQFAMLSAAASVLGRFLTGAFAGGLIDDYGYTNFYLITTLAALPGVLMFAYLWRRGWVQESASGEDLAQERSP